MGDGHPFDGRRLAEIELPENLLVVMIARGDELIIPRGDDTLVAGDRITVLGRAEGIEHFGRTFKVINGHDEPIKKIVIAGAGIQGYLLARMLEQQQYSVTIMEHDRDRCESISRWLKRTRIIFGDTTRLPVLKEERIADADLFVACTGDDELNLMSCLQVKSLGAERIWTVMNRPDYTKTVEQVGIDLAISPRHVVGNQVMALIKRGRVRSVFLIENGRAEVVEFLALPATPIVGAPLRERKLPPGTLIASILRQGQTVIPHGETAIQPGDIVVTLCLAQHFADLEKLFGSEPVA